MTMLPFGQIAPISRRAVAYLIDAVIAGGLAIVLSVVLALVVSFSGGIEASLVTLAVGGPVVGLLLLGWFVVYTWMQSGAGSIGMRAQGLRLARETDGAPLGFGRALVRNLIFGLAGGIVVGYFTPLFDGSGRFQGWHDKVAKSVVLDARAARSGHAAGAAPNAREAARGADLRTFPAGTGAAAPTIPGLAQPAPTGAADPQESRFAAPQPPTAQPAAAPPWPGGGHVPAPAATPAPAAPFPSAAAPAFPAAAPAAPVGTDDDLIAFVPGITQDAPPRRAAPAGPAPEAPEAPAAQAPAAQAPAAQAPAAQAPEMQAPASPQAPEVQAPAPQAPEAQVPASPQTPAAQAPAAPAGDPWAAPSAAAPAAASAPEVSPGPASGDIDIESTRISIPGHRLVLTWDDGTRTPVSRRTIFGRNPAPEEGAAVVAVRDETLSLSKTHFEAAAEVSGGWVLDRHSTNGTTIVRDGQRLACPPGQRVPVRLGDAIEIGDRIVTIGGYA
ncbi:RDD family protein [uncultured Microbacterium sp.]|uniref:RDD family protein n=1 Tax=uncultured Microbacterium sp. TaxID=191216 RepID=UPI0028DBED67|nr:RDD family protein [uncultured Microbacterium sp.]